MMTAAVATDWNPREKETSFPWEEDRRTLDDQIEYSVHQAVLQCRREAEEEEERRRRRAYEEMEDVRRSFEREMEHITGPVQKHWLEQIGCWQNK
jgi:molecular chaperone GrpE (heat shock protein)